MLVGQASLHELTEGAKAAIKQADYEVKNRAALEAAGEAPPPVCEDTHDDCGFFAEEGVGSQAIWPGPCL